MGLVELAHIRKFWDKYPPLQITLPIALKIQVKKGSGRGSNSISDPVMTAKDMIAWVKNAGGTIRG